MADGFHEIFTGVVAELARLQDGIHAADVDVLADLIDGAERVYVAGAGRSGLLLRCFVMRLMHMGRDAHMVGDITTPGARRGHLIIIGSGSGETASLAVMAEKAKAMGMTLALVTTNPESTIGRMADRLVVLPAQSPKIAPGDNAAASVQPMGNLFEQGMFLLMDCIVMMLMRRTGMTSETMFARHANLE